MQNSVIIPHYPEYNLKGYIDKLNTAPPPLQACTHSVIYGSCNQGHHFFKELVCGREWCIECGKKNSKIHQRRIMRWKPKAEQFKSLGYLVVTIPSELWEIFKNKKELSKLRTYVKRKLQKTGLNGKGYDRGLIRYHWAGDCKPCKGKGCLECQFTGAGSVWKPHLNIFIDEKFVSKSNLNKFRDEIAAWFTRNYSGFFNEKIQFKGNIRYNYVKVTEKGKFMHRIRYVTRATWRFFDWNICNNTLKGFRTSSDWGKWDKKEELIENSCPCCKENKINSPIIWGDIGFKEHIDLSCFKYYAGGFYVKFKEPEPPPLPVFHSIGWYKDETFLN